MKSFEHANAGSVEKAVDMLGATGSVAISGGTDLLARMKTGVTSPRRLVNLKTIRGMDAIATSETGSEIGALATLKDIAADGVIRSLYPVLAQAIGLAASPQLRNRGTIGGNLAQESRCWYYRGEFQCWLKGGEVCYARDGENRNHAIFAGGPCFTVHPSDPAVALIALDAGVDIQGTGGRRTLPLLDFFQSPGDASRQLTILGSSDIVTSVFIPSPPRSSASMYLKAMERRVWSFAQASVAAVLGLEEGIVRHARLAAGGVAPSPVRLYPAEKALLGSVLDEAAISNAADNTVEGAVPLEHSRYKLPLLKGLVIETLSRLSLELNR
jgi:xanthine dehydrogenase YagS FAD-binding subunit